ncbi:MAG: ABC transporter ATP-binding protein [Faecalibacterium sp.]
MPKNEYELGSTQKQPPRGGPGGHGGPGGMGAGEKAKDFKGTMAKLLRYAKQYRPLLFVAICFAMLGSILTLLGPDKLSILTDTITEGMQLSFSGAGGMDMDAISSIGVFLIAVYALSYLVSILQGVIMSTVMQTTARNLRADISAKINRLPMHYYFKHSKGDVLSRVTNDVDSIGQTLSQSAGTFVSAVTLLVGSLFMMSITNVILTITAILSSVIGFVFMMTVMRHSQEFFRKQQHHLGEINGHIEEMYAGHTVVKAYNGEANAVSVFAQTNAKLKNSAFQAQALSGLMMPMMTFTGNLGYVCVCIVGALLALDGQISFGVIVAFMLYIRLFTQPLGQIAQAMQNLQSGTAAAERVFAFLEEPEMPDESAKTARLGTVKGDVAFKNVHFGYDPEKIIINDFTASVKAGQKVAIVGPTGAGKTTMVNLLMRFYEINSGDILIDGVSIKDLPREEVHAQFSMVLQDTWLFHGTLRENLIYASENVSEDDLKRATKAVGLHHFVKTLERGYDTILSDKLELSQGQKQQITIARAMIADKPMLILDEATSSIDTRTELQIQKAMDALMEHRTSFVIAHRLSTIKDADLILVMKDGDVIETGNHAELLAQKGFYAELYNSQFES